MISTFILALSILFSGLIAFISFLGWFQEVLSSRWPSTKGEVINTEIIKKEKRKKSELEIRFEPLIEYRYNVNGKTYNNNKRAAGWQDVIRDEGMVQSVLDKYPKGLKLEVYYNPRKPEISVLIPGTGQNGIPMLFWSSLILMLSVIAIVLK